MFIPICVIITKFLSNFGHTFFFFNELLVYRRSWLAVCLLSHCPSLCLSFCLSSACWNWEQTDRFRLNLIVDYILRLPVICPWNLLKIHGRNQEIWLLIDISEHPAHWPGTVSVCCSCDRRLTDHEHTCLPSCSTRRNCRTFRVLGGHVVRSGNSLS